MHSFSWVGRKFLRIQPVAAQMRFAHLGLGDSARKPTQGVALGCLMGSFQD